MPLAVDDGRLTRATELVRDAIKTMGYAEALEVAQELGFDYAFDLHDGKFTIRRSGDEALTDLQMIAFACALAEHRRIVRRFLLGTRNAG